MALTMGNYLQPETKIFQHTSYQDTLSFAESLGFHDWTEDMDSDDLQPEHTAKVESDAVKFIREQGYTVTNYEENQT